MKLNPKVTGALAWGGLLVVLAVPSVDILTGGGADSAQIITSDMDQVRTASVEVPAATKPPVSVTVPNAADPVDAYVASGRKLPSYISDAPAELAGKAPAPTVTLVAPPATSGAPAQSSTVPDIETASVETNPMIVAPTPAPASMRPRSSVATLPVGATPSAATLPATQAAPTTSAEQPLIIDENLVERREAAVARVLGNDLPASTNRIDGDRLQEWDSGSLADYLERRGMLSGGQDQAQAYDEDFFDDYYEDEPPMAERRLIRRLPRNDFFLF